jgi:hypothetical protein
MDAITFQTNQITNPVWAADYLSRDHLIPAPVPIDAAQFVSANGTRVTLTANAAQNATSLTVTALTNAVPANTVLRFAAGKYAYTTSVAAKGATTVAVEALPVALTSGDSAAYTGTGKKIVESGIYVGRTFTERAAGTAFGPAVDTDDERFLLAFDIPDADAHPFGVAVRHGSVVKENFLPGFSTLSNAIKAVLRADYQTIIGAP